MDNFKVFNNDEFGKVRALEVDKKPYAVGVDVARSLGYVKPSQAVIDHCKGIRKLGIPSYNQHGAEVIQETNVIPESDIYRLIIKAADQSRNQDIKEKAARFESWVFTEVLPSIRKHGAYMTPQTIEEILLNPDTIIKLATTLKEEQEKNSALTEENKELNEVKRLLSAEVLQWADRKFLVAVIRRYSMSVHGNFSNGWNDYKKELLYKHGINLNSRVTKHMNNTGKKTPPRVTDMIADQELTNAISTAVAMCVEKGVSISDEINARTCTAVVAS